MATAAPGFSYHFGYTDDGDWVGWKWDASGEDPISPGDTILIQLVSSHDITTDPSHPLDHKIRVISDSSVDTDWSQDIDQWWTDPTTGYEFRHTILRKTWTGGDDQSTYVREASGISSGESAWWQTNINVYIIRGGTTTGPNEVHDDYAVTETVDGTVYAQSFADGGSWSIPLRVGPATFFPYNPYGYYPGFVWFRYAFAGVAVYGAAVFGMGSFGGADTNPIPVNGPAVAGTNDDEPLHDYFGEMWEGAAGNVVFVSRRRTF